MSVCYRGKSRLFNSFLIKQNRLNKFDVVDKDATPTKVFDPYLSTFPIFISVVIRGHSMYGVSISITATSSGATLLALQSYNATPHSEETNQINQYYKMSAKNHRFLPTSKS